MEKSSNILLRVGMILEDKQMSETTFAREIRINQKTLNNYMRGSSRPSLEFAEKILDRFDDVSAEWLIRGVGDMYLCKQCEEYKTNEIPNNQNDIHARIAMLESELNKIKSEL